MLLFFFVFPSNCNQRIR
uniref:Uncharacterized protein n=1 Tax=Rhizophora mucronata TaxID=61149 RepID=A0A2P2LKC3_RHIMU